MIQLDFLALIIIGLASFRITRFFLYDSMMGTDPESGSKFSIWFDDQMFEEDGTERGWLRGKIGDLGHCPWCLGFWVTLACTMWWVHLPDLQWLLWPWAAAGIQGFLNATELLATRSVPKDYE